MSSKQVSIDKLPFIRSSQTVRRINEADLCLREDNEEINLELQKSVAFPWEIVGHAKRTGRRNHEVQVENLPKDLLYKQVNDRPVKITNVYSTPSILDKKDMAISKQILSVGNGCASLQDLPHPSKLTKRKKYRQKKYSKLDLGKVYSSQLKKKLEMFNWPVESSYQRNDVVDYSEENMFESSSLPIIGEETAQQVPRTPILKNDSFFNTDQQSAQSKNCFSFSHKNELNNSSLNVRSYPKEYFPWTMVSKSPEWIEGDRLPLNFVDLGNKDEGIQHRKDPHTTEISCLDLQIHGQRQKEE